MSTGKIAVLCAPLETLIDGLEPSEVISPFAGPAWRALTGKNGGAFHAAPIEGGALVVPFGGFADTDEVALALRKLLGAALDRHQEPRGVFIASGETPPEGGYDVAVTAAGAFVPVPAADDPRLAAAGPGLFDAAAVALRSPEAAARVAAQAEINPLASAKASFDAKLASRADPAIMRDTLTAALEHQIAGGSAEGEERNDADVIDAAAARFRRAAAPAMPATIDTGELRSAVESGEIREGEEPKEPPREG